MVTYTLLFLTVLSGVYLGEIKFKGFKLGKSGTLFTGLLIGWVYGSINPDDYKNVSDELTLIFKFSLILFISAVGLIASSDIKDVFKKHGLKFVLFGFIVTLTGFTLTLVFSIFFKDIGIPIGIFSGALTSSPGLASAIESAPEKAFSIITGYSIGYIPGVLSVIFSMYLLPFIMNKNEKTHMEKFISINSIAKGGFNFASYGLVIILGILIGILKINLGIFSFKLGMTGGILISSFILGNIKTKVLSFKFSRTYLKFLQDLGIILFLSSIGLRSGWNVVSNLLNPSTLTVMLVSFVVASCSILSGFIFGKYLFKMDFVTLAGAICGGMTSTPGLGAAIDATQNEKVTVTYGATYPFALFFMVIFNKLLSTL